jgi:xanthine dehydrogenase accessory factor
LTELGKIIQRIQELHSSGEKCALATVVNVSGSAYRRPGARMLFSAKGREAGFVSAACMEADLFEKVKEVLAVNKSALFSYDTTAPEDEIFGIGQGCGGYVEILVEPVALTKPMHLLSLLQKTNDYKNICALVSVFNGDNSFGIELGTKYFIANNESENLLLEINTLRDKIFVDSLGALKTGRSGVRHYEVPEGNVDVFIEIVHPSTSLIIFGATPDVKPLVQTVAKIGWQVAVVDHRAAYAVKGDFPEADSVMLLHPDEYSTRLQITPETYAVIMIHQFQAEMAALKFLFMSQAKYIGLLGPKSKSNLLLKHLADNEFIPTEEQLSRLHNPVGLDIGAENADEIAISITAEIQAVIKGRTPTFLKNRQGPIH